MTDNSIFQDKKAAYYTLGCKLNFAETSTLGQQLKEAGVRTDASDLHADFIDAVFHTTAPEAAADKREQFYGVLGDSLEKGLTFDVE